MTTSARVVAVLLFFSIFLLLAPTLLGVKTRRLKEYIHQSSEVATALPSPWDKNPPLDHCPLNVRFKTHEKQKDMQLLCLTPTRTLGNRHSLLSDRSRIVVFEKKKKRVENFFGATVAAEMVEGFVAGEPDSSATGYLHDNCFYGRIYFGEEIYAVDAADLYSLMGSSNKSNAVIYREWDMKFVPHLSRSSREVDIMLNMSLKRKPEGLKRKPEGLKPPPADPIYLEFYRGINFNPSRIFAQERTFAVLCPICIVADHHYFRDLGKNSVELTVKRLIFLTSEAETIFRIADFDEDGVPDNIGLYIAEVRVYTSKDAEGNYMKSTYRNAQDYLQDFAGGEFDSFCLGIAVTNVKFDDAVLGLAWRAKPRRSDVDTGGICSKRDYRRVEEYRYKSYNTLVVTMRGSRGLLFTQTAVLNLAHEIGHAFGSKHDAEECLPGSKDPYGRYLMSPYSQNGKKLHHRFFSPCSKEYIRNVLMKNADCFLPISESYCGNGIVEDGEDCECGVIYEKCKESCCGRRQGPHACKTVQSHGCVASCAHATTLSFLICSFLFCYAF